MNEIVKTLAAADLPETLREGIDPSHRVEVTVRDLGLPDTAERLAADLHSDRAAITALIQANP